MAVFYPTLDVIQRFNPQPTEGEMHLLHFLRDNLSDEYEVYFNPYLNGDRPDVVVMRKNHGILIIEVKDWDLSNFRINEKRKWVYTGNGAIVKSPLDQVVKYKENLYDLHVENLLEFNIRDSRHFSMVSCAVYFHKATQRNINSLMVDPFDPQDKSDGKYLDYLSYYDLIGCDSLTNDKFHTLLQNRRLESDKSSYYFTDEIYNNIKRLLAPARHLSSQGQITPFTDKQKEIIKSTNPVQRVKGVFGSGKTTVLAERAVQAYWRAIRRGVVHPKILILTYNITLKNFIHDKLNRVYADFCPEDFVIINYHKFINAELNNLGVDLLVPDEITPDEVSDYLESHYYGNLQLFEEHKADIKPYDSVFIDEIQDYNRSWMDIIKLYFRSEEGDYVLFGDVKQNIYGKPTDQKDVRANVTGKPVELKRCFRSQFKVQDVALSFQRSIFGQKYELDEFEGNEKNAEPEQGTLDLQTAKDGYLNYMYLTNTSSVPALYNIIRGIIENKENRTSPNDITILGFSTATLKLFDAYYRYKSHERTNTMMEDWEKMYLIHLNAYHEDFSKEPWLKELAREISPSVLRGRELKTHVQYTKIRLQIAALFVVYDLYQAFPSTFEGRLEQECINCGIKKDWFVSFRQKYKEELDTFKADVFADDYSYIRENRKVHFWMNSGTVKISTINSFKGWESDVVFIILEPKYNTKTEFNGSFDELLYTGITRSIRSLVVINFGNEEYHAKLGPIINSLK